MHNESSLTITAVIDIITDETQNRREGEIIFNRELKLNLAALSGAVSCARKPHYYKVHNHFRGLRVSWWQ